MLREMKGYELCVVKNDNKNNNNTC